MKCYLCNNLAEYSCNCSNPNIFICENHLEQHIGDKSIKHVFENFEATEINLLINLKRKLRDVVYLIENEI